MQSHFPPFRNADLAPRHGMQMASPLTDRKKQDIPRKKTPRRLHRSRSLNRDIQTRAVSEVLGQS